MSDKKYDIVIIGSGLGGLSTAVILAKEGKSVCVLEKNNQFGGNLQTFTRDKNIFDTGVHYIGGLAEGENLNKYFKYLGIMNDLKLNRLDENAYDIISFEGDNNEYPHAQGYENFIQRLLIYFPKEEKALREYCFKIKEICNHFPMYNFEGGKGYNDEIVSIKAKDFLDELTDNEKLKAVLLGSNFLYVANEERTPLYVHALTVNSYMNSAWRCINGGSQISKLLIRELKKYGGEIYKYSEVSSYEFSENIIASCKTIDGRVFYGDQFISNMNLKKTIEMVGKQRFTKAFVNRIMSLEEVPSVFSVYIVFKPKTYKYFNNNFYHFDSLDDVWNTCEKGKNKWPNLIVCSMSCSKQNQEWAESLTVMTYLDFKEVEKWEDTVNTSTIKNLNIRSEDYEQFKEEKAELILQKLEKRFRGIRDCIDTINTSSPLTYRDFIGSDKGNIYGFIKDANNPMKTFISPKTKVANLFFSGQNVRMHGVLGVTVGAFVTCLEMIDKEKLLSQLSEIK